MRKPEWVTLEEEAELRELLRKARALIHTDADHAALIDTFKHLTGTDEESAANALLLVMRHRSRTTSKSAHDFYVRAEQIARRRLEVYDAKPRLNAEELAELAAVSLYARTSGISVKMMEPVLAGFKALDWSKVSDEMVRLAHFVTADPKHKRTAKLQITIGRLRALRRSILARTGAPTPTAREMAVAEVEKGAKW